MRRVRTLAVAAAVVAVALLLPGDASAHLGSTKIVFIESTPDGASMRVDLDPIDVAYSVGLPDPDDAEARALVPRSAAIEAWAERVFTLRSQGGACRGEASRVRVADIEEGLRMTRALRVQIDFVCPEPRASMIFRDDAIFDIDRQHESIVRFGQTSTVLRRGRQEVDIGAAAAPGSIVATFLVEWVLHLITGYDHILFLLSLLLVAGEVAARDGTRKAVADVALMVSAFTVGHSVTLIAAALDVVVLPSRLVESGIALSIIAVAVWNLTRPEARAGLRWIASAFGLVHGFGFSSVLHELILPAGQRVGALLAFNVGIELAQLGIVLLVVPLLGWAGRRPWYHRVVVRGGSYAIAATASVWFVQRAFGL